MSKAKRAVPQKNRKKGFAAVGICVLAAAILALTVRSFGFQLVLVRSNAMRNTLCAGDVVLLSRSTAPETGRIVYANAINGSVFRRVIGEPGDSVEAIGGAVIRNGAPLYEPYATGGEGMAPLSTALERGMYLLMADDRKEECALIEAGGLAGVAVAIVWPLSRAGFL